MSKIKNVAKKVKGFCKENQTVLIGGAGIIAGSVVILLTNDNARLRRTIEVTKDSIREADFVISTEGKRLESIARDLVEQGKGSEEECIETMCKVSYLYGSHVTMKNIYKSL